ncbi:MAG: zf-HC2 domain-containing protein [Anaerolineales bacterium]|nr:zf-HC2 domain-containing protein [Anaerolineales bacterium]
MNCKQAQSLFLDYLDKTLSLRDENALQAHLGDCPECASELAALLETQYRLRYFLRTYAAGQVVSEQIWPDLQGRIDSLSPQSSARRIGQPLGLSSKEVFLSFFHPERKLAMKAKIFLAILALTLVIFGVVLFTPNVWAQVSPILRWFRFEGPAGGDEVSISLATEFTPLRPSYLPPGFEAMAVGLNPQVASLRYWNKSTGQILLIDQVLMVGEKTPLPVGKNLTVNGQPAVLIEGLSGDLTFVQLTPTPVSPALTPPQKSEAQPLEPLSVNDRVEIVKYTNAKQLTWDIGNLRIQIVSNLPLEEILRIAESFVSAEVEEPNLPSNPEATEQGPLTNP